MSLWVVVCRPYFFGQATVGMFLCPQGHHVTLESMRGAIHAISAFTEVILLVRAVGLFF